MSPGVRRYLRAGFIYFHDAAMSAASFFLSLALRLGGDPWSYSSDLVITGTLAFTAVAAVVLVAMQVHREVWQYTSTPEILRILRTVTVIIGLFVVLMFWVSRLEAMPRSALIINWFVLVALMAGPRVLYRIVLQGGSGVLSRGSANRIPVLLIGAERRHRSVPAQPRHRPPAPNTAWSPSLTCRARASAGVSAASA